MRPRRAAPAPVVRFGDRPRTTPAGQLAFYRVYPERGSRLHFRVRIFRSLRAMRRYLAADPFHRTLGRHGKAMCSTWTRHRVRRGRRSRITDEMGEIVIPRAWLGAGVIAHEATHAALGWARRIGLQGVLDAAGRPGRVSDPEERFCRALGEISRQIAVGLYDRRILIEASDGP